MLKGKKILVGVSAGIAAYKAVELVSRLRKQGAAVRVVMTENATKLVSALTFREISGSPVAVSMWDEVPEFHVEHIALAEWADIAVIAPATANVIAKMAYGLADDMLSTTLLATTAQIVVCPAMNTNMYLNPVTQENLTKLAARGHIIIPPASGMLACGTSGPGRLPEPIDIVAKLIEIATAKEPVRDLDGVKVLITAAGTREAIDPVRYVGNRSSGKMGYAIAQEARRRGAEVTLISGPTALSTPDNIVVHHIESAREMHELVLKYYEQTDVVIKAAAVADYRPRNVSDIKIKKRNDDALEIVLEKNPDILADLGSKKTKQFLVGFAAETNDLIANAKEKICKKNLDMIVANDVTMPGAGFNSDTNIVKFIYPNGEITELDQMSKTAVANTLLDVIVKNIKK